MERNYVTVTLYIIIAFGRTAPEQIRTFEHFSPTASTGKLLLLVVSVRPSVPHYLLNQTTFDLYFCV